MLMMHLLFAMERGFGLGKEVNSDDILYIEDFHRQFDLHDRRYKLLPLEMKLDNIANKCCKYLFISLELNESSHTFNRGLVI